LTFLHNPVLVGCALLNAILALSMYVTFACGLFSFASVGFAAIGAYASGVGLTKLGLTAWPATLFAVAITVALAFVVAVPMLRVRGIYLALLTYGFTQVVQVVATNWVWATNGGNGLAVPQTVGNRTLIIVLVACCVLVWRWRSSLFGQAMDAMRQDELSAAAVGIETRRYTIGLFVASAALAGLGGSMYAQRTYFISPDLFSLTLALNLLLFVMVGGVYRWYGAVVGAFILTYVMQWMTAFVQWQPVILGALLTVTIVVAPGGLTGLPVRRGGARMVGRLRSGLTPSP
jgi:branched-chain amino acid transport system permease protein